MRSSQESQSPKIGLGSAHADEEVANDVGWQAIIGPVAMDHDTPVRQPHLARHRQLPAADQPDIRDGVTGCDADAW
jgi:hypothetical protein